MFVKTVELTVNTEPEETVEVPYRYIGNGKWEADIGNGFELYYKNDGGGPSKHSNSEAIETQAVEIWEKLREEYCLKHGGDPTLLNL